MSIKLRDLIRSVRACKTAADERGVITKECALIRTAIKEEDDQFRHRNVAKLMYIHMLGYPTHFGQMECLKLVSAVSFPEKRIGYLGLTLLLNEQTEVLTLVTNSLKLDLTSNNQYIQALSLIAIGNLATQDMARDLISDVEKLLKSNNSYLKKKAALATIRLLKKEPDLTEHITDRIVPLLKDRNHGVLITTLQLLIDIFDVCPEQKDEFKKIVPSLVRLLRNFISMGFSPEHDVSGVTDPFMQVKLLDVLRQLGMKDAEASEQMNDVLTQVATNTESVKNSGNSILYECVKTIMAIDSDSGLKTLAINILGRFLLNRDNNIRYVALQSLIKVVAYDNASVQRHRNTIVDCLKDPDVSIRQRALELVYQLVNAQNVEALTAELLNYLVVCQTEHKVNLVSHIMNIVEKYSPNAKWKLNTIITMLCMAGIHCSEAIMSTCILFISQAQQYHKYVVHHVYRLLQEDTSQTGFLQVGVWCIGEYSDHLLSYCPADKETSPTEGGMLFTNAPAGGYNAIGESDVVTCLSKYLRLYNSDVATKALILNALLKLTAHLTSIGAKAQVQRTLEPYRHSMNLELQQRSSEYNMLLSNDEWGSLRAELLAKMPVVDEATYLKRKEDGDTLTVSGINTDVAHDGDLFGLATDESPSVAPNANTNNLMDIFGTDAITTTSTIVQSPKPAVTTMFDAVTPNPPPTGTADGANMLSSIFAADSMSNTASTTVSDIFGAGGIEPQPVPVTTPPPPPPNAAILDLFGTTPPVNNTATNLVTLAVTPPAAPIVYAASNTAEVVVNAVDKNGFKVVLCCTKPQADNIGFTKILCKFSNATGFAFNSLVFQVSYA